MGSLTGNAGALSAFTGQPFPNGLDLARCVIQQDLGVFTADPTATFRAGMLVTKNASGIAPAAGKGVIGVAKWNKATSLYAVSVDEPVVLAGTTAVNLKHANVSNVKVTVDGTAATVTTDYTVNTTNGTVTRVGAGGITDGATALVTYTYPLTEADLDFQGRNFWNFLDDVSIQDNHVTVIVDWSILFTTQYDTSRTYTVAGTGANLYCAGGVTAAKAGLFTNDSAEGDYVGRVLQVPTATDPYLGVLVGGNPVAIS